MNHTFLYTPHQPALPRRSLLVTHQTCERSCKRLRILNLFQFRGHLVTPQPISPQTRLGSHRPCSTKRRRL